MRSIQVALLRHSGDGSYSVSCEHSSTFTSQKLPVHRYTQSHAASYIPGRGRILQFTQVLKTIKCHSANYFHGYTRTHEKNHLKYGIPDSAPHHHSKIPVRILLVFLIGVTGSEVRGQRHLSSRCYSYKTRFKSNSCFWTSWEGQPLSASPSTARCFLSPITTRRKISRTKHWLEWFWNCTIHNTLKSN